MKFNRWILLLGVGIIALMAANYKTILAAFFPKWEGFSATPYWDFKQWSWGYGTRVPGSIDDPNVRPSGTISRAQAMIDAIRHAESDRAYLSSLLTRDLNSNQWAALLSFSYNLGRGNADNLIPNLNAGKFAALGEQWNLYVNAGGVPQDYLIDRRAAEWQLFNS